MAMCSHEEVRDRVRTNEMSRFERAPNDDRTQWTWAVKKYRRPAAGRIEVNPRELRSPHILEQTLRHLFTNILCWRGCGLDWEVGTPFTLVHTPAVLQDFLALYHYLSDRVRGVRKDFVVQRVHGSIRVHSLVAIARFYILASYCALLFRSHPATTSISTTQDWSEALNDQQLASALVEVHAQAQWMEGEEDLARHDEVVAYDILLNLRDPHAVSVRLLKVPTARLASPRVRAALALFAAFHTGDHYRFVRCFRRLPVLQQCLALRHLPIHWVAVLHTMNKAYGKMDRFDGEEIAAWTDLPSPSSAKALCVGLGVHVEADETELPPPGPSTADSWEDNAVNTNSVIVPHTFARFKISTIQAELPSEVAAQVMLDKAADIFNRSIAPYSSATALILGDQVSTTKKEVRQDA